MNVKIRLKLLKKIKYSGSNKREINFSFDIRVCLERGIQMGRETVALVFHQEESSHAATPSFQRGWGP